MQLRKEIKFETLHKSHKKGIIIGVVVICIIGSVLVFKTTRAKYRFTQSIPFVRGTINYKPYDFKMMAMYQQKDNVSCTEDNCYNEISIMPANGYTINENKSYCTKDGTNKDTNAVIKTIDGNHTIAKLSKNEKCYLYFDKIRESVLLAKYTKVGARANYERLITDNSGKVYSLEDDDGTSYYFAGIVNNNWVKFAGFYWRIVRFNGDGTLRLIYSGDENLTNVAINDTTKAATGIGTQIGTSKFNSITNGMIYVGYRYTENNAHGTGTPSTIQGVIDDWYKTNIVNKGYSSKVDNNAGFCGDRNFYVDQYGNNQGTEISSGGFYGAYIRFYKGGSGVKSPTPTLKCKNSSDLYTVTGTNKGNKSLTYPVGLITADEVVTAGTNSGAGNTSYYLYTGQSYWTMSPSIGSSSGAIMFTVYQSSTLNYDSASGNYGVRPVINLRSDIAFASEGNGTIFNPYIVVD